MSVADKILKCLQKKYDFISMTYLTKERKWIPYNCRLVLTDGSLWLSAGMSNSNHCAGRTLIFKTRKTYIGPQFIITQQFESNLDTFQSILTEHEQILVIFYELL